MDDDVDALELDVEPLHDGPVDSRKVRRLLVDVDVRHRQESRVARIGFGSFKDVKVGEEVPALDAPHREVADDVMGSKLGICLQRHHAEVEDLFVDVGVLLQLGEAELDLEHKDVAIVLTFTYKRFRVTVPQVFQQ